MKKLLVILMAIAMVGAFTIPAAASELTVKGYASFETFMVDQDKDRTGTFDESDLRWTQQDVLSRISFKLVSGDVTGYVELRPYGGTSARHWFGEWDFGSGKLLVGHTWTPATIFSNASNYKDNIMSHFGNMNWAAARLDQIRFTLLDGNLKLGFLTPNTAAVPGFTSADYETSLPTIEAAYTLKLDPVKLIFCGGYASYDVVDVADNSETVTSNFFGLAAFANFGEMYVKAEAHISTNEGNYGFNGPETDTNANFAAGDVKDNDGLGYQLIVGYKASDTVKVEAGYGFISGEDDIAGAKADEASMMYVMVPITLAPGVTITPEAGVLDFMDDSAGAAQGEETYFGATWKIAF